MSDPSSFAETPLAQLRAIIKRMDKATDGQYCVLSPAVGNWACELEAILTDLEAAPPPTAKEQHLMDLYDALGIRWGDDPFPVVARMRKSVEGEAAASRPAGLESADENPIETPAPLVLASDDSARDVAHRLADARLLSSSNCGDAAPLDRVAASPAVEGEREDESQCTCAWDTSIPGHAVNCPKHALHGRAAPQREEMKDV